MKKNILLFALSALLFCGPLTAQDKTIGTNVGQEAPEIEMADTDGKVQKLSSLRGYLVLVDFWASWCGPCRHENPTLVKAYNTYSKLKLKGVKGFKIFSVSLDRDANAWKDAIEKDGLDWKNHVSDLKFWDNAAAKTYGVYSIPSNFLIDGDGIIVAKGLRGDALLMELEKYVKY